MSGSGRDLTFNVCLFWAYRAMSLQIKQNCRTGGTCIPSWLHVDLLSQHLLKLPNYCGLEAHKGWRITRCVHLNTINVTPFSTSRPTAKSLKENVKRIVEFSGSVASRRCMFPNYPGVDHGQVPFGHASDQQDRCNPDTSCQTYTLGHQQRWHRDHLRTWPGKWEQISQNVWLNLSH